MTKYLKKLIGHRKFLGLLDKLAYRASTFVLVILFSKILTKEEFGLFGVVMSLFMLFSILESFFQTATVKFCATSPNKKIFDDIINSLLHLKILSFIIFILLLGGMWSWLIKAYHEPRLGEILVLFPCVFFLYTLRSHFVSIIRAQRDMKRLLWQDSLFSVINIALAFMLMKHITTAKEAFMMYLLSHIISVSYLWIRYPQYVRFQRKMNWNITKEIFHYGKYSAFIGMGGLLYQDLGILMVGALNSVADVGAYKIGRMSANFLVTISQGILLTMLPEVSHLNEDGKVAEVKKIYDKNVNLQLLITVPFFILSLFFTQPLFHFFFQDKYAGASTVFIIFAASGIVRCYGQSQGAVLAGVGLLKLDSLQMICTIIVNVLLNFLLIPPYKSAGAAMATVVALSVGTLMKKHFLNKYYFVKQSTHSVKPEALSLTPKV